jgi:hypothetical protein
VKRLAAAVTISVFLLGATALGTGASRRQHMHPLGVIPHAGAPHPFGALSPTSPNDLVLNTQPCTLANSCWVMRTNTAYAIYWIPSGYSVDANYEGLINRYLTDVAAASGRTDNVYSPDTQYYDATGPIAYQSVFAGSYVDTNAFPASGCNDGADATCLTDQQIENEIQNVLTAKGWHGSTTTVFFVMTPDGVGSCFDGSSTQCTTNAYCAYHSGFFDSNDEPVVYANEPYVATIPGCSDGTSPNGDDADATINTISHEHNEAITDPAGNAWWSNGSGTYGYENGDLCAWNFGAPIAGTVGVDAYNQVIDGHHYWLQEEYSNDGSTCLQHYLGIPVNLGVPTVSGVAGEEQVLSAATPGTWTQSPTSYTYQWLRCSSTSNISCFAFPGDTGATYQLTAADVGKIFRLAVYAQNAAGTSLPAVSAPTAVVVTVPAATSPPVVSGVPTVGKTLSTTTGGWNTSVSSYAYQWLRCAADGTGCSTISGAASASYVLKAADAGHALEARVSATNGAGTTAAVSAPTKVVVARPAVRARPRISGKPRVGKWLKARRGTWAGPPTSYKYQWLRCSSHGSKCRRIKKATRARYRLTKRDAGHRLRVRVAAANAAGATPAVSRTTRIIRPHR